MFCLYCGNNLPDDAVFCNKCGKQQNAVANEPATDVTLFPFPPLSGASTDSGQPALGNVPMVQGTPSTSDSSSGQSFAQSAANSAPSALRPSAPSQAPSSASLTPTQHAEPLTQHRVASQPHPSHATPITPSHIGSPTSPAHYLQATDRGVPSDSFKLADKLSRRTVVAGLAGMTGLALVGGGLAWLTHSRSQQTSPGS